MTNSRGAFGEGGELAKLLDVAMLEKERSSRIRDRLFKLCEHTEENVRRWQDWRDLGLVRLEVAYAVISRTLDGMGEDAVMEAMDKEPLKGLYNRWNAIREREGVGEDEDFIKGEEPKDYLAVGAKIDKISSALHTGPMRKYGEHEMAELYLKDYAEYRRREEAGWEMLYAEPEIAEAQKQIDEASAEVRAEYEKEQREKEKSEHEGHEND